MFKAYRNPYSLRRRNTQFAVWKLLLLGVVGLVGLEFLLWLVIGLSGAQKQLTNDQGQAPEVYAYQLQPLSASGQPIPGSAAGELNVQPDWSAGYVLQGEQESSYWTVNPQGFRQVEALSEEKAPDEFRIFLVGGSAAFGQGLESNDQTIAAKLERRLGERLEQQKRSPEKYKPPVLPNWADKLEEVAKLPPQMKSGTYKVINAAVPGYASGNQLAQVALGLLSYQPDVLIVMNGYDDLLLESNADLAVLAPVTEVIEAPTQAAWQLATRPLVQFFRDTTIFRAARFYLFRPQPSLVQQSLPQATQQSNWSDYLPQDEAELENRARRYHEHMKQLIRLSAGAKIPLVLTLQPEITGLTPEGRSPEEGAIAQALPENYTTMMTTGYARLGRSHQQFQAAFPNSVKTLNHYTLFNDLSATAFTDTVNLTDAANQAIAERLYKTISNLPQLQVVPAPAQP